MWPLWGTSTKTPKKSSHKEIPMLASGGKIVRYDAHGMRICMPMTSYHTILCREASILTQSQDLFWCWNLFLQFLKNWFPIQNRYLFRLITEDFITRNGDRQLDFELLLFQHPVFAKRVNRHKQKKKLSSLPFRTSSFSYWKYDRPCLSIHSSRWCPHVWKWMIRFHLHLDDEGNVRSPKNHRDGRFLSSRFLQKPIFAKVPQNRRRISNASGLSPSAWFELFCKFLIWSK